MRSNTLEKLNFPALDMSTPAADQIKAILIKAIRHMDLLPGQALSESEIAQKLGASRTPVRSALSQLRELGLITTRPSRGNYVAKLSEDGIRSAQFVREAIELSFLRRIFDIGKTPALQAAWAENLSRQAEAARADDGPRFFALDDAFHDAMAQIAGMKAAREVYQIEIAKLARLRYLGTTSSTHRLELVEDHSRIFEAVQRSDLDASIAALQTHLRDVLSKLNALMASHSEYFEITG